MKAEHSHKEGGPLSLLSKGVVSAVGLATEVHRYRQEKKVTTKQQQQDPLETSLGSKTQDTLSSNGDSNIDDLDGDIRHVSKEPPAYEELAPRLSWSDSPSPDAKASRDLSHEVKPLPDPIILSQRRPGSKARGFIRAYPSTIGKYKGIDQTTFLSFLKEFHQQSQASHIFEIIMIGAEGGKWAPSAIAMAVGMSVQVAAVGAKELQARYRTNNYLDKINHGLFHPVNLHAMIMAFDPDSPHHSVVDLDTASGGTSLANSTRRSGLGTRFKVSAGTTTNEADILHAAPLLFPVIEDGHGEHTDRTSGHNEGGKMKHAGKFFSGYLDRRAQAKYAAEHGADSALAIPGAMEEGKFASKFSNPNHPASSGSLRALLPFGGSSSHRETLSGGDGINGETAAARDERGIDAHEGQGNSQDRRLSKNDSPMAGIKKFLKPGVLYLLIAEIPPLDELERLGDGHQAA